MELTLIQKIVVWTLPVLFAITIHEAAHAWMASRLGDKTAQMLGRVTLNPLKHIDPFGTVVLPLLLLTFSNFLFGWAKPVPINSRNLGSLRRDMALVALAGPGSNLLMALFWAIVAKTGALLEPSLGSMILPLKLMGTAGVLINSALMALNIVPILPLDGGRILNSLLPPKQSRWFSQLEPYGLFIVVGLLFTGILWEVAIWPIMGLTIDIMPATDVVLHMIPVLFAH